MLVAHYRDGGRVPRSPALSNWPAAAIQQGQLIEFPAQLTQGHFTKGRRPTLRSFVHVRADSSAMQRVQRVVDATFWPLLCGGCHTGRDTAAAITTAGFTLTTVEKFAFPETKFPTPAATHILGAAERPRTGGST